MKKLALTITAIVTLIIVNNVNAQSRESAAVLDIDSKGVVQESTVISSMVRTELEKLNKYSVMDRYDIEYNLAGKNLEIKGCYGTMCVSKMGEILKVDKVITGSVERFGEKIIYTLRLVDVKTKTVEQSSVLEFENLQTHLQKMTRFVLANMYGVEKDEILFNQLAYIEEPVINNSSKLNASGPRMGLAYITEGTGTRTMQDQLNDRGAYPVLTQFGYQHEVQYLSSGNFQALFEIVGLATGMDQGMFIPSISFLNGFRNSKTGFEMAFGPVLSLAPNRHDDLELKTKFAWAIGKTFKSGHLNIPINVYVTPNKKDGWFIGGSFGFNLANKKYSR